ncbi:cytochrome p450 monooxygenase [Grosmannia clavigera kw1407]|uniref:Cytochrome p450 monooxygenase n=1 Tax=Grosmannia clavigera (strain kw1407 / UAMH 11150) TaxID=655863 RepID=F0XID1_GROCL|nr:cytochrome p450 monooxygenase [Grosmannia clavigera kw1407]EFX02538.1 cytochrome p450 monooxygenase [Grosmannia clavigera kw1407]
MLNLRWRMLNLRWRMPLGPFPWPVVGNVFTTGEQAVDLLRVVIETINDAWCAHEILEKKAQVYASRPRMVVFGELGTGQTNLVTMRVRSAAERDHWRIHRKLMHLGVGVQAVRRYRNVQNNVSKAVALEFLCEPAAFVRHLERHATSVVSVLVFGRRVPALTIPSPRSFALMQLAADLNVPGRSVSMPMETFPILARFQRWVPWMRGIRNRNQKGGHYFFHLLAQEAVEQQSAEPTEDKVGIPRPFADALFTEALKYDLATEELSSLTGSLFGTCSDTTSSTLVTFVLACCAFPEPMRRAQAELDRVFGSSRSPDWDDSDKLPGQALAEQGVWIAVARLLWAFTIQKARDPNSDLDIDVDIFAFTNGLNMRPQPFRCDTQPRTLEIGATIEREGREALLALKPLDGESRYRMSTFYQAQKRKLAKNPIIDEVEQVRS